MPPQGNNAIAGFMTANAAEMGRGADRPADIAAQLQGTKTGSQCGGSPPPEDPPGVRSGSQGLLVCP